MKLCKDCIFCIPDKQLDEEQTKIRFAKCSKVPENRRSQLVGGELDLEYCSVHRDYDWPFYYFFNRCGHRGRWFQPKLSK